MTRKTIQQLLLFCILKKVKIKKRKIPCLHFKTQLRVQKTSYFLNGSKQRRTALYCSNKLSAILR